jgi:hypothetical protein
MSRFVLDPGGSREIGLCPHSRIYPLTKLATPLGNLSLLYFWLSGFSVAIFFGYLVLLICKSLSPQDTLSDLLGLKASLIFA